MAIPAWVAAAATEILGKLLTAGLIVTFYDDLVEYAVPLAKDALGYSAWHDDIQQSFGDFGELFFYLFDIFQLDYGMELMFTTLLARFMIRRMPFIN